MFDGLTLAEVYMLHEKTGIDLVIEDGEIKEA